MMTKRIAHIAWGVAGLLLGVLVVVNVYFGVRELLNNNKDGYRTAVVYLVSLERRDRVGALSVVCDSRRAMVATSGYWQSTSKMSVVFYRGTYTVSMNGELVGRYEMPFKRVGDRYCVVPTQEIFGDSAR